MAGRGSVTSLRIRSADLRGAGTTLSATLLGGVTVFDGFSVFNQPVEIELGGVIKRFTPDRSGRFRSGSLEFTALNASPFGVVYGGEMEFRLVLRGAEWRPAFPDPTGSVTGDPSGIPRIPVRVRIGSAVHNAWVEPRRLPVAEIPSPRP